MWAATSQPSQQGQSAVDATRQKSTAVKTRTSRADKSGVFGDLKDWLKGAIVSAFPWLGRHPVQVWAESDQDQTTAYRALAQFNANLTTQALATVTIFIAVAVGFTTLLAHSAQHHGRPIGWWGVLFLGGFSLGLSGVCLGLALITYTLGEVPLAKPEARHELLQRFSEDVDGRRVWIARGTILLVFPLAGIVALLT